MRPPFSLLHADKSRLSPTSLAEPNDIEKQTQPPNHHSATTTNGRPAYLPSLLTSLYYFLHTFCTARFTLHDVEHIPDFLRTPYILTSYRVLFSFPLATRSLFHLHNETLNIWTHGLAALYLLYLSYTTVGSGGLLSTVHGSDWLDYVLFSVFHWSAVVCFSASALYHWYGCMSVQSHSCLYIGDMSAIGLLILGSYVPGLYYAFYCRPLFQLLYIATIVSLVAAYFLLYQCNHCHATPPTAATTLPSRPDIALPATHHSTSARQHSHWLRVLLLVSLVAFAVVPALHFTAIVGTDHPLLSVWQVLWPLVAMLALYGSGFGFYVSHFPERVWERRFDVWLSSHQFWHCFILLAVRVWHYNLVQVFEFKSLTQCSGAH